MEGRCVSDIEIDKVLDNIRRHALSKEGREHITPSLFTSDTAELERRYLRIDTISARLEGAEPLYPFPSITHIFDYVERTHSDIPGEDIWKTGDFLSSWHRLLEFEEKSEEISADDVTLKTDILSSLSPEGDVNENHPRLFPLIRRREEAKAERQRFSSSFISENRSIVQNANPIYRNERVVIPIFSSEKNSGSYYVSGQSGSGSTTYVEPFPLVELNNRVVLTEEAIRVEKLRIVHDLSERVRTVVPFLRKALSYVVDFDFHYSFALFVRSSKARHPRRGDEFSLIRARHPLLGASAVPVDVHLEKGTRVLVLSGANAGGKTVTMKTMALSVFLNQMCSFIPADELSILPIYDNILSDIGDGQSIEESASTFSSHMTNIARIARKSTGRSLVVLDELGSGTDPEEGAVLSVSVLKYLASHSALTVCTSHYSQVKNYAYTEKGMMNASMEFDEKTSRPTYTVLAGIPGDSHAISTAKRSGMPREIVEDALSNLSSGAESSARIITSLLSKSRTLDRKIGAAESARREAEEKVRSLEKKEEELERRLLEAEKEGHRELREYLASSRKELEKLVKDISTGNLTREKTRSVKAFIAGIEEKERTVRTEVEKSEEKEEEKTLSSLPFRKGDEVLCGKAGTRGLILEERGRGRFFVSLENGLRMEVRGDMLTHAKKEKAVQVSSFTSMGRKAEYEMDVRGLTMRETEERLDGQIEAAVLSGMPSFSIIHGYGDGILQKGIHIYLRKSPIVKDYRFALPEDGGMGKTYVFLNSPSQEARPQEQKQKG